MSGPVNSIFSLVFLLHVAAEAPFAVQALWAPLSLPLLEITNTTLVFIKLFAALSLSVSVGAFLCWPLPEYLPGKRAFGLSLLLYHASVSTIIFQAPRFIPFSLGEAAESIRFTPETAWALIHVVLGLGFASWWQLTIGQAAAFAAAQRGAKK
ncbi:hypothetical protein BDY24DRAFT_401292 [Mrakia frigida]|uniref:uncharacterized protein n=1 Tax=Mrakia frigida TaxID=29902 RepID=UPI003FCBFE38